MLLLVLRLLLMLSAGRCTNDQLLETKTVHVGERVSLSCPRKRMLTQTKLYWIRLDSGGFPHFIGRTFSFHYKGVNQTPHFTTKQGAGTFLLNIKKPDLSDTGLYYCMKTDGYNLTFLKGVFLTVKGPDPGITAIIEEPIPGPVHPGDPVTLQCSVLSGSDSRTCPRVQGVYWFTPGSDKSQPRLIFTEGDCRQSPETQPPQECVYSFSKNVSSSDAGTYHCAVATCGQVLFGNGTKLDIDAVSDSHRDDTVVFVLCAALAASLIVITGLICTVIKTSSRCDKAASCNQRSHERNEDALVYSRVIFKATGGKAGRRRAAETEETVRTDVRPQFTA